MTTGVRSGTVLIELLDWGLETEIAISSHYGDGTNGGTPAGGIEEEMKANRERLEVKIEPSSEKFEVLREKMWTSQEEM